MDLSKKDYVVIVQCHIVKERCPGYLCEKALLERTGGFSDYPADKQYRFVSITCGGCCGRALHRKLAMFKRVSKKQGGITPDKVVVQLSSCITKDNYHATPCPHRDYLKKLIEKVGYEYRENTVIAAQSEKLREKGVYASD